MTWNFLVFWERYIQNPRHIENTVKHLRWIAAIIARKIKKVPIFSYIAVNETFLVQY